LYPRVQIVYLTTQVRQTPKVGNHIARHSTKSWELVGKPISMKPLFIDVN